MIITITEFRKNLSYYISRSEKETIIIKKNNDVVAILKSPKNGTLDALDRLPKLFNASGEDVDTDEIICEEMLAKHGLKKAEYEVRPKSWTCF